MAKSLSKHRYQLKSRGTFAPRLENSSKNPKPRLEIDRFVRISWTEGDAIVLALTRANFGIVF